MGKTFFILANIVVVVAIFLSYLATHISPKSYPYLAFFGIGYGMLLLANIGFIFFWILVKKRLALISLIAILIGFNHFAAYFQLFPGSSSVDANAKSVKVLSQNVHLFGWYNWRTNVDDRDQMFRNLEVIDADVYCFQEFFHNSGPDIFETKELLKRTLDAPYLHDEYTRIMHQQHYGIATVSKYPIVNKGRVELYEEHSNICIFTDINVDGEIIRVYNAHVASIRFSDSDYKFLEDLGNESAPSKPDLKDGMGIVKRLNVAYKKRAKQVNEIIAHIDQSPYPVIFCGDLNDTPVSYSYGQLSKNLEDAFRESGWGIGNTYIGKFPSFRIDYILYDKSLRSDSYQTHEEEISDHHAISSRIYLDGKSGE